MKYDAIVAGAGAAGIFAARELALGGAKVLLLEMGPSLEHRLCPRRETRKECFRCDPCRLLYGWGGAGAFSDGKLSLSSGVGGFLPEILPEGVTEELLSRVDSVYLSYGAPEKVYGGDPEESRKFSELALSAGLTLVHNPLRHMGTDKSREVLALMERDIKKIATVRFNLPCEEVLVEKGAVRGVRAGKETFKADTVILAGGRSGAGWMKAVAEKLKIPLKPNPVDIGVRVECPYEVAAPMTTGLYEAKLRYLAPTFRDEVRTFCMNPGGEVVHEVYEDCLTVNGHSYAGANGGLTNFALLVTTRFTEPFDDPLSYGKFIARLANLLSGGILVQRYADLVSGKRSNPERIKKARFSPTLEDATPGDLSFALPHRHLVDIIEMMTALDRVCPGLCGEDTFLYGAEVKLYSSRIALDENLETPVKGLYCAGDGAGVSRGLMQASASGMLAARAILKTKGVKN